MSKDEAIKTIICVLREIEENLTDEKTEITSRTRPIGEIIGFDSLAGVVATLECLERFKINNDKIQSIFIGEDSQGNSCSLTVEEVADKLVEISNK